MVLFFASFWFAVFSWCVIVYLENIRPTAVTVAVTSICLIDCFEAVVSCGVIMIAPAAASVLRASWYFVHIILLPLVVNRQCGKNARQGDEAFLRPCSLLVSRLSPSSVGHRTHRLLASTT